MAREDRRVWLIIGLMVILFVLTLPLSIWVFHVNYDYTLITVALGGMALGMISGMLGAFAVLRQQSLMGDALSHAALPGVAMAFLIAGRDLGWLLVGAGIAGWLGVLFINAVMRTTRIKQDAAMGMTLAAYFAIGIVLLSYIQTRPDSSQAGLDSFIFGQAAAIVRRDVLLISLVGALLMLIVLLFWKEFKLITFDPEFASANGFRRGFFELLLSTLVVVAVVLGLQLAGVVLMVGMLIAPAVAARQWARQLEQMVILSAVFGAFAGASGAIISGIERGLPTGPLIIVVAFLLVLVSILFAPERGLVWKLWGNYRDRRRFAAQNIVRDIYRHALQHQNLQYAMPVGSLLAIRGRIARAGLRELRNRGLVAVTGDDAWFLTESGAQYAEHDARNQRLWRLYRSFREELNLPLIPEDHQQDISRVLPSEAVEQLVTILRKAS